MDGVPRPGKVSANTYAPAKKGLSTSRAYFAKKASRFVGISGQDLPVSCCFKVAIN